eukprot:CAMPEP_0118676632 /NCGR_PEP_ID=MMETSP0800-20121206/2158_1 /TAXON_ID=210618 ORGANISM="Striatella unipunctata, Strain CCMP2910" /NCGR_SAMPLE_ID=MMETSP0800 /ASSEMBLY_ACC=CAM_ASM_000638 /LENGTH=563 /DNA_ID=CAMNT_0006572173 /DNA_START=85 /DNA_END=1776 /DNA_ORIENTATION=+
MSYETSTQAGYAILYVVLAIFTLLAFASAMPMQWLPDAIKSKIFLKNSSSSDFVFSTDYFLSARNSAGTWALALSYFAGGMGAWVVYGTTEMGANPNLSWFGVLGYSGASAFPAILVGCWLGPIVRKNYTKGFATTDFGLERYGRIMQITIAGLSIFYMFIFVVAELTSISNVYALLVGDFSNSYGRSITISLGVATVFYTSVAGLPASIVTDKFQGVLMGCLVVILTIAVSTFDENHVSKSEFKMASAATTDGLMAAVTLVLAILSAELFNQSTWQRVWAAESETAMRNGFVLGSVMVFFLMMFFGIMGMLAYANDPTSYDNFEKFSFLAFFDILEPLPTGWHILVLILVTALAASSIDSLQNGLSSVFSSDILKLGDGAAAYGKWFSRFLVILINIPAIIMASKKYDVISLFLVADLVCATSVLPVFLGLRTSDYIEGVLVAPTELGAFCGCLAGVVTVVINGIINDAGGLFEYFWLRNNAICALCGSKTMFTFIITPVVSGIVTILFSQLDVMVRGRERAQRPLIELPFDKKDNAKDVEEAYVEGDDDDEDEDEAIEVSK